MNKISQTILHKTFKFSGSLPSDPKSIRFDFETNNSGVRVRVGVLTLWPNKREKNILSVVKTVQWCIVHVLELLLDAYM